MGYNPGIFFMQVNLLSPGPLMAAHVYGTGTQREARLLIMDPGRITPSVPVEPPAPTAGPSERTSSLTAVASRPWTIDDIVSSMSKVVQGGFTPAAYEVALLIDKQDFLHVPALVEALDSKMNLQMSGWTSCIYEDFPPNDGPAFYVAWFGTKGIRDTKVWLQPSCLPFGFEISRISFLSSRGQETPVPVYQCLYL